MAAFQRADMRAERWPEIDAAISVETAASNLRDAIAAFRAFSGELQPHLAYGACTKAEYEAGSRWNRSGSSSA